MARFLAYLAGPPHHGLPSHFLPAPNPHARPKSIEIDMGWPTSLTGGERPGGDEFGCKGA
jgi:hypothetical protein